MTGAGGVHSGPREHVLQHELAAVGHPHQAPAGRHGALRDAGGARRARRGGARAAAAAAARQPHAPAAPGNILHTLHPRPLRSVPA